VRVFSHDDEMARRRRKNPEGKGARLALYVLGAGIGGWLFERVLIGPPESYVGRLAPFLPTYALGGLAIAVARRPLAKLSAPARFAFYAAALTSVEYGACQIDRATGPASWGYGPSNACVDLPHALLWGAFGLAGEVSAKLAGV
jgi:hypothetical protein